MTRIARTAALFLLLAPSATAGAPTATDTVKRVLNGALQLSIPADFTPMSEERRMRFPAERRPSVAFVDKSGAVSIAITQVPNGQLFDPQVETAHRNMIGTLREAFPMAQWHRNDRKTVSGHPGFLLDFDAPTAPSTPEARYVILGAALGGKLLTITFRCPPTQAASWLPVWDIVVQSVTFVE